MKVVFLSLNETDSILHERSIYGDLLREFLKNGWKVVSVCPGREDAVVKKSHMCTVIKVKTARIAQASNLIKKGLATIGIGFAYKKAVKKHAATEKFDLVLYPTPPVTLAGVANYIKKRDGAKTYLLLKDIFPQNAVDLGMMSKTGIRGIAYKYFRAKEKQLYAISDYIGCMSPANVRYLLKHNPEIDPRKVEVCPNSVEFIDKSLSGAEKATIREKYGIPPDKTVFVYGGNLGKPQGIPFIIECLKSQEQNEQAFFLIIGDGTEYGKLETYLNNSKTRNMKLLKFLPKDDYDRLAASCDVGMIFLDHRFTIPNFPSRLLSYMQAGLPVLACTDANTDIGKVITEGGFGWWCESDSTDDFVKCVQDACSADRSVMGKNASKYLEEKYTVKTGYQTIASHLPHSDAELTVDKKSKIMIFGFSRVAFMPYLFFYLDAIKDGNSEIHVITWQRNEKPDKKITQTKVVLHPFECRQTDQVCIIAKIKNIFKYRKFAMKLIKSEEPDIIVLLHTMPSVLLSHVLCKKYANRFIFDYRDSTYEWFSPFKKIVGKLVKSSYATFVSSDGFRRLLPEECRDKTYTSHNLLLDSLNHRDDKEKHGVPSDKIRIAFWGFIRNEELNVKIISKISRDNRFELHYYGREERTALNLKNYVRKCCVRNVFFHGEYNPEDRYKFVCETDIIHNIYRDSNMMLAMGNKYYDGIIFRIPQICVRDSFMGKAAENAGIGFVCDPDDSNFTEQVYRYYRTLDWRKFKHNCDIELDRVLIEYRRGTELLKRI